MYITSFEYDGRLLEDFTSGVCNMTSENGIVDVISVGNDLAFNTVSASLNNWFALTSATYQEALTCNFQIGKFDCDEYNELVYSEYEIRRIMRWLNRKEFKKFRPIYDDGSFADIYFMGSFNVQLIRSAIGIIGFDLTFTTDSPYAYGHEVEYSFNVSANETFSFSDVSDEMGFIYPDITLTPFATGTLKLHHIFNGKQLPTSTFDCYTAETISIDGKRKIITTDSSTSIADRFNYVFPTVNNEGFVRLNEYVATQDCSITFKYNPIVKIGVIL